MIADTHVLLRALDADAGRQATAVRARIEAARSADARITVLAATVLEVAYVLESTAAGYGWDRQDIARAIDSIVNEPAFDVEHAEALATAADTYRSRSIDLHDCLLGAVATQRGTHVLSFDADLANSGSAKSRNTGRVVRAGSQCGRFEPGASRAATLASDWCNGEAATPP